MEIRANPTDKTSYGILKLSGIKNVTIRGGKIVGERNVHKGTKGEWGMWISVIDSTNIKIENMEVNNCWGD